ncbi:MAG: 16S rRNA (cytosine1402-N4)-methyltransferase [Candidatus Azotimanducaceae bacterium]|jgi:16S rRNA (cytosine1402-N4)-methyltransferase
MAGHETVLKQEAIDALVTNPHGVFVDCTYGRGGHTQLIIDNIAADGKVLAIDKDLTAIEDAARRFKDESRFEIVHGSFRHMAEMIAERGLGLVDGVLIDLGVSSPQLDEAERGFSFSHDGPLDMRMDQSQGQTAAEWLNSAKASDIAYVIRRFGEEKFARRIAYRIVDAREEAPLVTTGDLARIVEAAVPFRDQKKHPATKTFQAIRIFLNDELQDLEACLDSILPVLAPGARLVVISFHSLEDRIVKRFMRDKARGEQLPSRLPIRDADIVRHLKIIGKPVKPSEAEVRGNRRSRSSIMRIGEKLP